jgi:hypothetical protein
MNLVRGNVTGFRYLLDAGMPIVLNVLLYFLKLLLQFLAACHTNRRSGDIIKKISALSTIPYVHILPP